MSVQNTKNGYLLLAIAGFLVILGIVAIFSWGSAGKAVPTATISVNDIYTSVAQTIIAQQATQQASNPPTTTPFPTLPLVATQAAFPTAVLLASPTTGAIQGCDNSVYVKDITIPDKSIMTPGQNFIKTWLVQNNGTCAWDTTYKLAFVSGEAMSGATTALTTNVPPGQQIEISVKMTAPSQAGDFTGYWRMINKQGAFFGTNLTVVIKVSGATGTVTATGISATPTVTNTLPSPTATPVTPTLLP